MIYENPALILRQLSYHKIMYKLNTDKQYEARADSASLCGRSASSPNVLQNNGWVHTT